MLPRIVAMTSLGHLVPAFAVAQFLRVAAEQGQAPQMRHGRIEGLFFRANESGGVPGWGGGYIVNIIYMYIYIYEYIYIYVYYAYNPP